VQVEVKKAEPRDVKMIADCHCDSSSPVIDVTEAPVASVADNDDAIMSPSVTGRKTGESPLIVLLIYVTSHMARCVTFAVATIPDVDVLEIGEILHIFPLAPNVWEIWDPKRLTRVRGQVVLSRHPQRNPASLAYLPLQQSDNTCLHPTTHHLRVHHQTHPHAHHPDAATSTFSSFCWKLVPGC